MKKTRSLALFIIFLFSANLCLAEEVIRINFIDVGDTGDAIFIKTPNHNVLIDAGGLLYGQKMLEYLRANNVKKITYFIISHPHLDHMAGAFFIIPQFEIYEIFDNGQDLDDNEDAYRWYKKLVRTRGNYHILKANDILKIDGIVLEVLWPDKPNVSSSSNANSLVIMLKYKNFRCLFTSDLNNIGEKRLLENAPGLKTNILKVAHHGYFDATSKEFLNAASPQYAIISVDVKNIRGAPSEATLNLLKEKGIKIYRTDKNGNIVIAVDENGRFKIRTQR